MKDEGGPIPTRARSHHLGIFKAGHWHAQMYPPAGCNNPAVKRKLQWAMAASTLAISPAREEARIFQKLWLRLHPHCSLAGSVPRGLLGLSRHVVYTQIQQRALSSWKDWGPTFLNGALSLRAQKWKFTGDHTHYDWSHFLQKRSLLKQTLIFKRISLVFKSVPSWVISFRCYQRQTLTNEHY